MEFRRRADSAEPHRLVLSSALMPTSDMPMVGVSHRKNLRTPAGSVNRNSQAHSWVEAKLWPQAHSTPDLLGVVSRKKVTSVEGQEYQDPETAFPISTSVLPRVPSATASLASDSSHTALGSSTRTSSATAVSNQSSFLQYEFGSGFEDGENTGLDEKKKEKKAKLQMLYKRASKSTKAFARLFSRSSTPKGSPPNGGVKKRSSIKPPPVSISPMSKAKDRRSRDQPAPSTGSSFGFSVQTPMPPLAPVRRDSRGSYHATKTRRDSLSIDVRTSLQRSSSVSSPLGVPTSPSSTRNGRVGQASSIRGRDSPFPVKNSSSVSLPLMLERERERTVSQGSVSSNDNRNQVRPPMPRPPTPSSKTSRSDRKAPIEPPGTQAPLTTSMPRFIRRPRSKSVYEIGRSRKSEAASSTEALPTQNRSQQRQNNISGDTGHLATTKNVATAPDPKRGHDNVRQGGALVRAKSGSGEVDGRKQMGVAVPPTRRALRKFEGDEGDETTRREGNRRQQKQLEGPKRVTPAALPPSIIEGLAERHTHSRAGSRQSSREFSPAPSRPQTPRESPAPLDHRSSIRLVPSLPSLRTNLLRLPLTPRAASHYEESKQKPGAVESMHVRSPSAPTTFSEVKGAPEPLPSSVTKLLRTRARSFSRSKELPPPENLSTVPVSSEVRKPILRDSAYASMDLPPLPGRNNFPDSQAPTSLDPGLTMRSRAMKQAATKSPSMPDLRLASNPKSQHSPSRTTPGSRAPSRRPSSPPPPLPEPSTKAPSPPTVIHRRVTPNATLPRSGSAPQIAPYPNVLRSKSIRSRPTELSYPSTNFQSRPSGSSLDAQTGPTKFSNVQISSASRGENSSSTSRLRSRLPSRSPSGSRSVTYNVEQMSLGVPQHDWEQAVIGAAF